MLINWVLFKAPLDKTKVIVNLRTWINKKFCKAVGGVLVSVCNVFSSMCTLLLKVFGVETHDILLSM